jgi:hypothetical protein
MNDPFALATDRCAGLASHLPPFAEDSRGRIAAQIGFSGACHCCRLPGLLENFPFDITGIVAGPGWALRPACFSAVGMGVLAADQLQDHERLACPMTNATRQVAGMVGQVVIYSLKGNRWNPKMMKGTS